MLLNSLANKLAVFVVLISFGTTAHAAGECSLDHLDIRFDQVNTRFSVEIAQSPSERAIGLMHRESLGKFSGMLFVYEKPQNLSFWMRNTLISLDMLFIDEKGIVRNIHENATPLSEETIFGGANLMYVLEINAGMSAMLGLGEGAEIRHPLINGPDVVWVCD